MVNFHDPILSEGNMMFSRDVERWRADKPTILLYLSCHGRTMIEYFTYARPDICEKYNILRLETGPMTIHIQNGVDIFAHPTIQEVFRSGDIIVTYNMGARMQHHELSRVAKFFKQDARVITVVAPNFGCFCPWSYDGFASHIGLLSLFDKGLSKEKVWDMFVNNEFDPMFALRWRLDLGRIMDKEGYSDIGLATFIIRNYKKVKLWMGPSHPTYIVMAHYGNEVGRLLGFPTHTEEQILAMDYTKAAVGGQPETNYEFNHFKFQYPMRHTNDLDDVGYYRRSLDAIHKHWEAHGEIRPQVD